VKEIRKEGEVWELLKKERRKRKGINEGIEQGEWKEYFMELINGGSGKKGKIRGRERAEEKGGWRTTRRR